MYILHIPAAFCSNSWMLELYLAAIPGAFWLHSRHLPTIEFGSYFGSHRTALIWHSKCILNIMTVFWIFVLCSNYIRAAFESQYIRNVQESFDAGWQWIRSIWTAFFKTWNSRPNVARILEIINSGWFCFIPAKCDGAWESILWHSTLTLCNYSGCLCTVVLFSPAF